MRPDNIWQKVLALGSTPAAFNITELFGPGLSAGASIYETSFTSDVSQRWSVHRAPSFVGAIKPATVEDVQSIVKIAAKHKVPFLATGGGHGVSSTLAGVRDGVQVDLGNFNDVNFDAETGLLTVGGSVKFSQIIDVVHKAGYQFRTCKQSSSYEETRTLIAPSPAVGTAPCVGVLGATLGGGVSANQGRFGLLSDILQSVELVTAQGSVVHASRTDNADLFWALRGAGANYGVVTSATFKVPEAINEGRAVNANFLYAADKIPSVFDILASLDSGLPQDLALNIFTGWNAQAGGLMMILNANYYGREDQVEPWLDVFQKLGPLNAEVLDVPWTRVYETSYFGINDTKACGRRQHINMYSVAARRTDAPALSAFVEDLAKFSQDNKDITTSFVVHRFATEAVMKIPDVESAYAYRDVTMHLFLHSARAKLNKGAGYNGEQTVYVNFAHGDEGRAAWYGERKLERLGRVKSEWDPDGLFSFYNPVPTADDGYELRK
ncbi:Uncharacterized protein TCAP_00107 [Tolypocladium capitatum]|uniref:FAD-binding PCMH-type domain-containing protein n=1 Tax=Tolypocladium capitatum TaxID=45235 RepID=A0A2K3QR08_9HYPO|nr:Uncharacterized protein TCAP_00107 [Tolypocladium capitatum]